MKFCDLPGYYDYLSSCGANTGIKFTYYVDENHSIIKKFNISASVYRISEQGCNILQLFVDEDSEEYYYASCWGSTMQATPLLLLAGLRGIIKVLNCITFTVENLLIGHGGAVNELKIHPINDSLCLSASKDESIRLWNIRTGVCIAIFAGDKGHRYI